MAANEPEPVTLNVHHLRPYTPGPEEQDEIAAMIAKHRQRGRWLLTLPSADLGKQLRAGDITKVALTRALAARMRDSAWGADAEPDSELGQLMLEMSECETDDQAEHLLGLMYDAADADRVWIEP